MLECVVNLSEGRDLPLVARLGATAGRGLLDVHSDPHHHRSVLTLVGEEAARAVAAAAVAALDLSAHAGAHPRLGVVDVVPFVALAGSTASDAIDARDRFARWFAGSFDVPCFRYGPERSLPEVRRRAFGALRPDFGPSSPHPRAGATAVGQRSLLVAYNVWVTALAEPDLREAAIEVRGPGLRTLGLVVGPRCQVSMNLIAPDDVGVGAAYDRVVAAVERRGGRVEGAELVGLAPASVLAAEPRHRWAELDLDEDRTIEARLEAQGWR